MEKDAHTEPWVGKFTTIFFTLLLWYQFVAVAGNKENINAFDKGNEEEDCQQVGMVNLVFFSSDLEDHDVGAGE